VTSVHGRASAPSKVKCKHNASFHVVEKSIAYNARKMHDRSCESGDNARNCFTRRWIRSFLFLDGGGGGGGGGGALDGSDIIIDDVTMMRFVFFQNIIKFASLFFQLSFAL